MSFEPERPAKRRKIDESCEGPEVRPIPYMEYARIYSKPFYSWYSEGIFVRNISVCCRFFTIDEYERSSRN